MQALVAALCSPQLASNFSAVREPHFVPDEHALFAAELAACRAANCKAFHFVSSRRQ